MKYFLQSPLAEKQQLAGDLFRLVIESPKVAKSCRPGQFINVKVSDENYPLLRRPLSIHDSDAKARLDVVFRVVGMGTKMLASATEGSLIDLIGPLGTPFRIHEDRRALLVGGGVGIPPVHALFKEIRRRKIAHVAFAGIRSKSEIGLAGGLPDLADECLIATDDGSLGHHGPVTDLLEEHLGEDAAIYACGPRPMLEKIIAISKETGVPAQVAFEQQMACAFGACIGCSIETNKGYQRVCTEGPVFDASLFF
jgi:dihydroorotate dehydrogenase electron transfer subunit